MAGQNSCILGVCDILGLPRPEYLEYRNSQSDLRLGTLACSTLLLRVEL
jgi:hypothetical protein